MHHADDIDRRLHWKRRLVIGVYPYALLVFDLLLITAIFLAFVYLRYDENFLESISRRVLVAIAAPSVVGVYLVGGYNYNTDKRKHRFISEHIIASIAVAVSVFVVIYAVLSYGVMMKSSRFIVGGTLVLFPVLSIAYRVILTNVQAHFERGNTICIIGAGSRAQDLYARLLALDRSHDFIVISFKKERVGRRLIEGDEDSPIVASPSSVNFQSSIDGQYVESYIITSNLDDLPIDHSKRVISALFRRQKIYAYEVYLAQVLRIEPPSQLSINWIIFL